MSQSLRKDWDIRIGSPQAFFRALEDLIGLELLREHGYDIERRYPKIQQTGITGVGVFEASITSSKTYNKLRFDRIVAGVAAVVIGALIIVYQLSHLYGSLPVFILIVIGAAVIAFGLLLISRSSTSGSVSLVLLLKGESYRSSRSETNKSVFGISSDARMTFYHSEPLEAVSKPIHNLVAADFAHMLPKIEELARKMTAPI